MAYNRDSAIGIQEPRNFSEAECETDKDQLEAAMSVEMSSVKAMGFWTLVERPQSRIVIRK